MSVLIAASWSAPFTDIDPYYLPALRFQRGVHQLQTQKPNIHDSRPFKPTLNSNWSGQNYQHISLIHSYIYTP